MQQVNSLASKPNPSAVDDVAIIFSYMRMLDPNSVVREGEFATAQNATGVPEQIQNMYNRVLSGNRLNPKQRQEMISAARSTYVPARNVYNDVANRYRGYARDSGVDPGAVAYTAIENKPASQSKPSAPVRIKGDADYAKLAKGQTFIGPDGITRRKP